MVQGCLQRMRQCYEVCHGHADRIVDAVARHFRQLGQGPVGRTRMERRDVMFGCAMMWGEASSWRDAGVAHGCVSV